jgi:hypothetical protein
VSRAGALCGLRAGEYNLRCVACKADFPAAAQIRFADNLWHLTAMAGWFYEPQPDRRTSQP